MDSNPEPNKQEKRIVLARQRLAEWMAKRTKARNDLMKAGPMICESLRSYRVACCVPAQWVARELGTRPPRVYNLENGSCVPSDESIEKYLRAVDRAAASFHAPETNAIIPEAPLPETIPDL